MKKEKLFIFVIIISLFFGVIIGSLIHLKLFLTNNLVDWVNGLGTWASAMIALYLANRKPKLDLDFELKKDDYFYYNLEIWNLDDSICKLKLYGNGLLFLDSSDFLIIEPGKMKTVSIRMQQKVEADADGLVPFNKNGYILIQDKGKRNKYYLNIFRDDKFPNSYKICSERFAIKYLFMKWERVKHKE